MKNVWVVEKGQYSDYRVVGVYSTQENAQKVCELLNAEHGPDAYDAASIAEWTLDPAIDQLNQGMSMWHVHMLRDGTTEKVKQRDLDSYDMQGSCSIWRRSTTPLYAGRGIPDVMSATVWATDEKHAVKIVNEKRAQMIATGEWQ